MQLLQYGVLTTAVIAFREFLEVFLLVGVFFGISKKLQIKKEFEIGLAAAIGILLSFLLATGTYFIGDQARSLITEENMDLLEGYLLVFSGLFIAYVVLSLHKTMGEHRKKLLQDTHTKLQQEVFDTSLFLTIVFMVLREGFEIALFTASTSLFSVFLQNVLGLLVGFFLAGCIGFVTYTAFIKMPLGKVFKWTEYLILLIGAGLLQNGLTILLEEYFHLDLSKMLPLPVSFIPDEDNVFGHILHSLFGIDNEFSVVRLLSMLIYIGIVYILFLRSGNKKAKVLAKTD